jgi:hypothetical protein
MLQEAINLATFAPRRSRSCATRAEARPLQRRDAHFRASHRRQADQPLGDARQRSKARSVSIYDRCRARYERYCVRACPRPPAADDFAVALPVLRMAPHAVDDRPLDLNEALADRAASAIVPRPWAASRRGSHRPVICGSLPRGPPEMEFLAARAIRCGPGRPSRVRAFRQTDLDAPYMRRTSGTR